jgi:peptidoglycan biosynthesis protein MviN/MurJ (putative lipid II flippase)
MNSRTLFSKLTQKIDLLKSNVIFRSVVLITLLLFVSRFLGLIRTILSYFKLSRFEGDLILNADIIPSTISSLFLMGTVFSSVLPVFSRLSTDSKEQSYRFVSLIILYLSIVLLIGIGLCFVFIEPLLTGFTSSDRISELYRLGLWDSYVLTSKILLITPLNFGIQAVFGVILNFNKKFLIYSLAGILSNCGSILGLYMSNGDFVRVAIGMALGTTLSSLLYIWACLKIGFGLNFKLLNIFDLIKETKLFWKEIRNTLAVFVPRLFLIDGIIVGGILINKVSDTPGQSTAFEMATSIQGAFLIIVTSLGMVFFPDLSKTLNDKTLDKQIFWDKLGKYLQNAIFLGIFISVLCILFAPVLMKVIEFAGKGQDNGLYIVTLVQISAFRLFFQAVKEILDKYLYTKERIWQPMLLSTAGVFAMVVVFVIGNNFNTDYGILTMLSLMIYYMVWCLFATIIVRFDYQKSQK